MADAKEIKTPLHLCRVMEHHLTWLKNTVGFLPMIKVATSEQEILASTEFLEHLGKLGVAYTELAAKCQEASRLQAEKEAQHS